MASVYDRRGFDGPQDDVGDYDGRGTRATHVPVHSVRIQVKSVPDEEEEREIKQSESPRTLYKNRREVMEQINQKRYPKLKHPDIAVIPVHGDTAAEHDILIKEVRDEGRVPATETLNVTPRNGPEISYFPINPPEHQELPDYDMEALPDYKEQIVSGVVTRNETAKKTKVEQLVIEKKEISEQEEEEEEESSDESDTSEDTEGESESESTEEIASKKVPIDTKIVDVDHGVVKNTKKDVKTVDTRTKTSAPKKKKFRRTRSMEQLATSPNKEGLTVIHDAPLRRNTIATTEERVETTIPLLHRKLIRISKATEDDSKKPKKTRKEKKLKKMQKKEDKKQEKKDRKKQKKLEKKMKKKKSKKRDVYDDDKTERTEKYSRTDDTSLGPKKITTTEPAAGDQQFYYYNEQTKRKDDIRARLHNWVREPFDNGDKSEKGHSCLIS